MKINPFENSNPMSWKDALKVSLVVMVSAIFLDFLVELQYYTIAEDPVLFVFNLAKFMGKVFFASFLALAGLSKYTKGNNE